jgi:cell division protease FtsH
MHSGLLDTACQDGLVCYVETAATDVAHIPAPSKVENAGRTVEAAVAELESPKPTESTEPDESEEPAELKTAQSVRATMVAVAIEAVTTAPQRNAWDDRKAPPIAVVIEVPSTAWVRPVENYFNNLCVNWTSFARTGSNRTRDVADVGNDEVSSALAGGRHVVGIAINARTILPSALVAAADETVKIGRLTGDIIASTMQRCLSGSASVRIDEDIASSLDLDDAVAAFRPGSTPEDVLRRLQAATASRKGFANSMRLPNLETAVEWGTAREWGLALAHDVADYKAGVTSWAEIDRGAVLHSTPGCGKDFFILSLGVACNIPVVSFSIGAIFATSSGHLDGVTKKIRETFSKAIAMASPCAILHWSECDALPSRESLESTRSHNLDWWLPVLTDLYILLDDALGSREGLIVIGSTNRVGAIDPALLRPGRLERTIEIGRPDAVGALNILRFHLHGTPLEGTNLGDIGEILAGSTAAEIMEIVRASKRAARQARRDLTTNDLRARILGGSEPPAYLRRIAVHEAGHAVVAVVLNVGDLKRVQLRSQGTAGGHTFIENAINDLATLAEIENRAISVLAGGVAEKLIIGSASTGAGGEDRSDLGVLSQLLAVVHASTSLTGDLFHRAAAADALDVARSDPRLRRAISQHLLALEIRTVELVRKHGAAIIAVADALAASRHLSGDAVRVIVEKTISRTPNVRGDTDRFDDNLLNSAAAK